MSVVTRINAVINEGAKTFFINYRKGATASRHTSVIKSNGTVVDISSNDWVLSGSATYATANVSGIGAAIQVSDIVSIPVSQINKKTISYTKRTGVTGGVRIDIPKDLGNGTTVAEWGATTDIPIAIMEFVTSNDTISFAQTFYIIAAIRKSNS